MINKLCEDLKFSGIASVIEKANALKSNNLIRLEVGDVDLDCPSAMQDGINYAFNNKLTHYPPLTGVSELKEILAKQLSEELNKNLSSENILITPGGSMGMFYIFGTILNAGDEVIVLEPMWPHLKEMLKFLNVVPVCIGLKSENNFHIDFKDLKNAITNKTKAILINIPNNPTGVMFTEQENQELATIANEFNLMIISDEEYCDYEYNNNKFNSIFKFTQNAIISRSFSKIYSAAGLRLGYVCGDKNILKSMSKLALFSAMYPSSIIQHAIVNQKSNLDQFNLTARKIMHERADILVEGFNSINGLSCVYPEGGLYVWLNCSKIMENDVEFCDKMLYDCNIAMVPGSCFGETGKGYIRVSLGADKLKMQEAIKRIKEYFKNE